MPKATTKKKVKTGFCGIGSHEGTKPVSHTGVPMPICTFWDTCSCDCHDGITKMYVAVGMDRKEPEQSPEYLHYLREQRHQFVMPSSWESPADTVLSSPDGADTPPGDERPVAVAPVPVLTPRAFDPTPTGRRARGSLEQEVLLVCVDWVGGVFEQDMCTPKFVSEEIGKRHGTEPPSTGAINAVWDRWDKFGFAEQAKKPSRFVKFTAEATNQLDRLNHLKAKTKREKKRGVSEARRGFRAP